MAGPIQPLPRRRTVDIIADEIRRRITDGTFAPGQQLNEVHLAGGLNRSRGPVREALSVLVSEGLLVSEQNRGTSVVLLTSEAIKDVYFARSIIETTAAHRLSAMQDADLFERLRTLTEQMGKVTDLADWSRLIELDVSFHTTLVEAARSERLQRMFGMLMAETRMCMVALEPIYSDMERLATEHAELIDVIRDGSEEDVIAGVDAHLQTAVDDLMRAGIPSR